jgi:phosphoenolpyruvate-protein kinase (PTS system EI component)
MGSNSARRSLEVVKIYGGDALGKVISYELLYNKPAMKWNQSKKALSFLASCISHVHGDALRIERGSNSERYEEDSYATDSAMVLYSNYVNERVIKYLEEDQLNIRSAFESAVRDFLTEQKKCKTYPSDVIAKIEFKGITKKIVDEIDRRINQQLFKEVNDSFILALDRFDEKLLFHPPHNMKGIVCKQIDNPILAEHLANERGISIVLTKETVKHKSTILISSVNNEIIVHPKEKDYSSYRDGLLRFKDLKSNDQYVEGHIKLHVTTSDRHYLKTFNKNRWLKGVCGYLSQLSYLEKTMTPKREEFKDEYIYLFSNTINKEVFINIPYFSHKLSIAELSFQQFDIDSNEENPYIMSEALKGIAEASIICNKELNIVIPMVRSYEEFDEMRMWVEMGLSEGGVDDAKIGVSIETKGAYDVFECFQKADFIIIQLDQLILDIKGEYDKYQNNISVKDFTYIVSPYVKDIHQYFRGPKVKRRHIVAGKCLSDPQIFRKIRVMGFREIAIPAGSLETVVPLVLEAYDAIGKYSKKKKDDSDDNSNKKGDPNLSNEDE